MQPTVYHEGPSAGSWTHPYGRKTLHLLSCWLQQAVFKGWKTQNSLEITCKLLMMIYSCRLGRDPSFVKWSPARKVSERKAIYSHTWGSTTVRSPSNVTSQTATWASPLRGISLTTDGGIRAKDHTCVKIVATNSWGPAHSRFTWGDTLGRDPTSVTSAKELFQRVETWGLTRKYT